MTYHKQGALLATHREISNFLKIKSVKEDSENVLAGGGQELKQAE